jgi:glycerophosphoryl diester phosphodiesterase
VASRGPRHALPAFDGLLLAHRGRCGELPENAVEALPHLPAVLDGVEVDVRTSRDGVPILMHDPTVDRTTGGTGRVDRLEAEELLALPRPDGARVPTLADYLDGCEAHGVGTILLDIKAPATTDLAAVLAVVRSGPSERCVLLARGGRDLATLRSRAAELRLGSFGATMDNVEDHLRAADRYGVELVFVRHGDRAYLANREAVARIRARGVLAGASTVNHAATLTAAVEDGCAVLLTDVADRLERVRRSRR